MAADLYVGPPGALDASAQGYFPRRLVERVRALPGVAAADTYRGFDVPFRGRLVALGATNFRAMRFRDKLQFLANVNVASLAHRLVGRDAVVVSDPFVEKFGLHPGDGFTLRTPSGSRRFLIVAQYNDYSTSEGTFIMDDSTYRRLFHDDLADSIAVYVRPGVSVARVRSEIVRALAPLRADLQTNREIRGYVIDVFDRTFAITDALYVISIAIALMGVVSTLFALVLERSSEIALLRYVGLTVRGVRAMVYAQAAIVGLLAGIAGTLVGFALSLLLIYVINRQSFGWLIELHVPWLFFFEAIVSVTIAALLAAIYPAGVAARIRTAEALRVE